MNQNLRHLAQIKSKSFFRSINRLFLDKIFGDINSKSSAGHLFLACMPNWKANS